MKQSFKITKLAAFLLTLILMLAVGASVFAKGSEDWKKAEGSYTWKESSQYNNGKLIIKPVEEDLFLFSFDVMRGSEAEDSAYDYALGGIFLVDDKGTGEAEFEVDKKLVKLNFTLKDKTVTVKQTGTMPADVSGAYEFTEKTFEASEAAAAAILEGIAPVKTSLNETNRPYQLVYGSEAIGGWFHEVKAVNNGHMFARFLVASDLSAVYRADEPKEPPVLIFGSPASMLTAKTVPLENNDEEAEEEPAPPEGATEEKSDGKGGDAQDQTKLSAVVEVGPEEAEIKVGESSKLVVKIPGNLKYNLSDLKSSAADKISVDGKGILTAKAEGTAEITGKLTVDEASKDFKVKVEGFVPGLACDVLPTHLDLKQSLKLSAYIRGQEGDANPEWSVSDTKIAEIKDGVLTGKADGIVEVTAKQGDMKKTWKVAVGKSEFPKPGKDGAEGEEDDGDVLLGLVILALPVVAVGGIIWWLMKRRKK